MTQTMEDFINGPLRSFAEALACCKAGGGYTVRESAVLEMLDKAILLVPGKDG